MRFLQCSGCGYTWAYVGRGRDRTTCPACFKTVYFRTGTVDAEAYRVNALKQLEKWCEIERHHINEMADAAKQRARQLPNENSGITGA